MYRLRTIFFLCLGASAGLLPGCKKFLDKPPDNQHTPVTVEDYTTILNGEGWGRDVYAKGQDVSM